MTKKPTPRKFTMTRKRGDWVEARNATVKGEPMRPNEAYVTRQGEEAAAMVERMNKDVSRQVMVLFDSSLAKESVAMDASISSQAAILLNALQRKWQKRFNKFASDFTKRMVGNMEVTTSKDLKKSMEKMSGGLTIKTDMISDRTRDIIKASSEQSTSLIKTVSTDYMSSVKESVMRSITDSTSTFTSLKESIDAGLKKQYKTHKNKAKNIALDQTRKVYNNLADSRMLDAGLDEYIWRHAGGSQNPRSHHKYVLNGQKCSLSNPPIIDPKTGERGTTGQLPFCSCYKEPVFSFG